MMTSEEVAHYLADHAEFFEEHAALLAQITLKNPHGGRAISLHERQMQVLREKIKQLELNFSNLVRTAEENALLEAKFSHWTDALFSARNDVDLPHVLTTQLMDVFSVPQATLRVWNVAQAFAHTWYSVPVSADARTFADGLMAPYCGINAAFEAAQWLEEMEGAHSLAIVPLRVGKTPQAFGLLVLASHDTKRFHSAMGTDFLKRIGETASAALTCLLE